MSGLVLGVESVPDGLASGLLAGVNPVAGLYACMFGTMGAALVTSSTFMAVQATGAMAIIVADVDLGAHEDPAGALFTLSILTGILMIVVGAMRLGSLLRFVSNSVMTGFITAVGVNIVLGQLDTFTGYVSEEGNRVLRALELVIHFWEVDPLTLLVGGVTIALIVVLERSRLGALGMVVAVGVGSVLASLLNGLGAEIQLVADIADMPRSLPAPQLPIISAVPPLILPAASLAFVGLVQGAGVSAGFPNADGSVGDTSKDFVGQGAGNLASGFFQGMPVGGSMSATSLTVAAGARTRAALLVAAAVMAVVVAVLGDAVGRIAMPSLAGLLIVVGIGTIKPANVLSVGRTGTVQLTVMMTTLVLTMLIPLQYAVVVGVAISVTLFVGRQSSRLTTKRLLLGDGRAWREVDPPESVGTGEVVVLQPYGSVFFAAAPMLEEQMPDVGPSSTHSVVILRLRGIDDAGATLMHVLRRYAAALATVQSKLVLVTDNPRVLRQMEVTGTLALIGAENVYLGSEWVGRTVRRAHRDALRWIEEREHPDASTAGP